MDYRTATATLALLAVSGCSGTFMPIKAPADAVEQDTALTDGGDDATDTDTDTDTDSGDDGGSGDSADSGGSGSGGSDSGGDDTAGDDGDGDGDGDDDGTDPDPEGIIGYEVPDFSLVDLNPSSPTFEQPVSPRDLLAQTTGWYFTHAT